MRIVVQVKAFYDWEPLPDDVKPTEKDIKAGKVRPGARGSYLMRVKKIHDTHTTATISEEGIIRMIIHEAMPQQGSQYLTRQEAVGLLMARNIMPHHAHPSFMKSFEVDDDGPDEKLFMKLVEPYVMAIHEASGEPLIAADDVKARLKLYTDKPAITHADHLYSRFKVVKPEAEKAVKK